MQLYSQIAEIQFPNLKKKAQATYAILMRTTDYMFQRIITVHVRPLLYFIERTVSAKPSECIHCNNNGRMGVIWSPVRDHNTDWLSGAISLFVSQEQHTVRALETMELDFHCNQSNWCFFLNIRTKKIMRNPIHTKNCILLSYPKRHSEWNGWWDQTLFYENSMRN